MYDIESIDDKIVDTLLTSSEPISLIFTRLPADKLWRDLNNILNKRSDHIICFWGNVGNNTWTDLSFLKLLNKLKRIRIQANMLSGSALDPLNYIDELVEFYIGDTYSNLSIMPLIKFKNTLEAVFINGKKRNAHIMYEMHNLSLLSLRNSSFLNPNLLKSSRKLRFLNIDWNDYNPNLLAFELKSLKHLSLHGRGRKWIKQDCFDFSNLKSLNFNNYSRLVIPGNSNLKALGRLAFTDCKNIENIIDINMPNIEEIALYHNSKIPDDQIKKLLSKYNIKVFYSDKFNKEVSEIISEYAKNGKMINQQNFISSKYAKLAHLDWYRKK